MNAVVFDQSVSFCLLVLVFGGPDHKISDSRKGVGELVAGLTLTSISMRPAAAPPTVMSKKTVGFGMIDLFVLVSGGVGWSLSVAALRLFSGGCTRTPHPQGKGGVANCASFLPIRSFEFCFFRSAQREIYSSRLPIENKKIFLPPLFFPNGKSSPEKSGGGENPRCSDLPARSRSIALI